MLKESEVQLRAMGETLLADIVGLVRETLVLKKKDEGIEDLLFPKATHRRKIVSTTQPQQKILK